MNALAGVVFFATAAFADTTQEHVHNAAHGVMPFDMSQTVHVFVMTDEGGIQKVVAREKIADAQIEMIRHHLQHEAEAFSRGDFADPGHLHGESMPGLAEMKASANKMHITYASLPDGAQITFKAADVHTITAIHRWFGAQLSEHGADAKAE